MPPRGQSRREAWNAGGERNRAKAKACAEKLQDVDRILEQTSSVGARIGSDKEKLYVKINLFLLYEDEQGGVWEEKQGQLGKRV